VNVVYLLGRVGQVNDMRYTAGGKAVINFSLATNEGYGERQSTTWHDIVAWDKQAEYVGQYIEKGMQLLIEGRIQRRQWEAQDGSKRTKVEVVAFRVTNLSPKKDGAARRESGQPQPEEDDSPWGPGRDVDPDEVPF
jgi:single-strand DNA-binding protein